MRILTAYERVAVWHLAINPEDYGSAEVYNAAVEKEHATTKKLYHLTDTANFKLKPQYHPQNNTTLGGDWPEAGVFLGEDPNAWARGYGYWRPYVAEFDVPGDMNQREGVIGGYSRERFIPSRYFHDLKLNRVIPWDAYIREQFGSLGDTENPGQYGGEATDFETGQPHSFGYYDTPFEGYHYQGDVRDRPHEWQIAYQKRFRKFRNEQLRQRKMLEDAGI